MSKIGFKLSASNQCSAIRDTHTNVRRYTSASSLIKRIVLRKDDDVKRSQIKGYRYLVP